MGVGDAAKQIRGLSEKEVLRSREQFGDNNLTQRKRSGFMREFARNFGDPLIKILLIALAVNVIIRLRDFDWYETVGIAVAILISTFVSTLSEYGSESAFEKLQEDALKTNCRVKRSGEIMQLPVGELVVGDYVLLQSGERIPADGAIAAGELTVDQSPLNGESREAYKSAARTDSGKTGFDDPAQLFRGCVVLSGECVMLVQNVGGATYYGKIAQDLQEDTRKSPLKERLAKLAGTISKLGYCGAALVLFANLFYTIVIANGFNLGAIMNTVTSTPVITAHIIAALTLSISVIVVAVPEGLPLMITVVLSSNMKRMLRDNVLVRKLVGIETSGNINILFTDKTGTLTRGKLKVSRFLTGDLSFDSYGKLKKTWPGHLLGISALYNTAAFIGTSEGKAAILGGNATERALLEFAANGREVKEKFRAVATAPFSSSVKFSGVQLRGDIDVTLLKGAPELILPNCTHYYDEYGQKRKFSASAGKLRAEMESLTNSAHRLLALAASDEPLSRSGPDGGLTLIGIAAIRDEVRREVRGAVEEVVGAGIQVVMITGDNKDTAVAVAREVGLLRSPDGNAVITSSEMKRLSDEELRRRLPELRVVARAVPADKSRLVAIAQDLGLVAGMTGDGINDAPALKKADIGFSMGSGAEVAKEASDIVILDDNFMSISKAVLYGRTIFKSIRKFIIFQLTINFCAVGISVIGPFIGIDAPITVLQMLWINMVMDTLAGLAFAGEAPLREYMKEPPKKRDEPILTPYMYNQIVVIGSFVTILCVLFFTVPALRGMFSQTHYMTAFFALFIFAGVFNSFNARTSRLNILVNILKNKAFMLIMLCVTAVQILIIYFGGSVFRTTGLTYRELQWAILLAFTVIPVDMIRKAFIDRRLRGKAL